MARKPRDPYARAVGRAVGGSLRHHVSSTYATQTAPNMSRNEVLDCIATGYHGLGTSPLQPMNQLQDMNDVYLARELVAGSMLQPALDALAAKGISTQDGTLGGFLNMTRLSPSDMRQVLVFPKKTEVWSKTVGGRCRGLKRT